MTFLDRIESLSTRFLSERTHELIVAPAIADLQYDSGDESSDARGRFSVVVALAGAAYEEMTSDLRLLKIAGLALIPAIYYSFLFILVIPPDVGTQLSAHWGRFAIASGVTLLSFGPVLACCWPERAPRKPPADTLRPCSGQAGDA